MSIWVQALSNANFAVSRCLGGAAENFFLKGLVFLGVFWYSSSEQNMGAFPETYIFLPANPIGCDRLIGPEQDFTVLCL